MHLCFQIGPSAGRLVRALGWVRAWVEVQAQVLGSVWAWVLPLAWVWAEEQVWE